MQPETEATITGLTAVGTNGARIRLLGSTTRREAPKALLPLTPSLLVGGGLRLKSKGNTLPADGLSFGADVPTIPDASIGSSRSTTVDDNNGDQHIPSTGAPPDSCILGLSDKARHGSYEAVLLKCIGPDEFLLPVPPEYNLKFIDEIVEDFKRLDRLEEKRYRPRGGIAFKPVAVGINPKPAEVSRIFISVWADEQHRKYVKKLLSKCKISRLSPNPDTKVKVYFFDFPNSRASVIKSSTVGSKIRDAWGIGWFMKEISDRDIFTTDDVPGHEPIQQLFCGQRLHGFRDETLTISVTLGGFITIGGLPFIVTTGHHLLAASSASESNNFSETSRGPEDTDTEINAATDTGFMVEPNINTSFDENGSDVPEEWDPDDYTSDDEDRSQLNSEKTSSTDSESTSGAREIKQGNLVFRLQRDPKSPVVGIEYFNEFASKHYSRQAELSDDWSIIQPIASNVSILGNRFLVSGTTQQKNPAAGKIAGVLPEADIQVNQKIRVIGPEPDDTPALAPNKGAVSSVAMIIKLPGEVAGFFRAWSLSLDRPIEYGESGSWIVDEAGRAVGQLTAGLFHEAIAYFIPVSRILQEIKKEFPGQQVKLYGEDASSQLSNGRNSLFTSGGAPSSSRQAQSSDEPNRYRSMPNYSAESQLTLVSTYEAIAGPNITSYSGSPNDQSSNKPTRNSQETVPQALETVCIVEATQPELLRESALDNLEQPETTAYRLNGYARTIISSHQRQSSIPLHSYCVSLELYTSETDFALPHYCEYLEQFRSRKNWGDFKYRGQLSLRCADSGIYDNLGDVKLEQPRYLVVLPKEFDQKVFWMLHGAGPSDRLSDGQMIGYWQTKQTEDGKCIHVLHSCPPTEFQLKPSYTCGQLFRIILGDTPHLLKYREPCSPNHQSCLLRLPLPLLWGLAAAQLNQEHWEYYLPKIISGQVIDDRDCMEIIVNCPREEVRLVSIQVQGYGDLDEHSRGFVTIPSGQ